MDPIPAVEREVGFDLARRAALVAPAVLLVAFLVSGVDGLAGAALALVLVAANFLAGALSLAWAGQRGPERALRAVAVGGFLVRMAVDPRRHRARRRTSSNVVLAGRCARGRARRAADLGDASA